MSVKYADRAFISVNGQKLLDLESCSLKQNKSRKAVPTMSSDGYNRGFVEGNWDIDITAVIAVVNTLARPKLEKVDYESNTVQITMTFGADVWTAGSVFLKDVGDDSSGVGSEVKTTFNFGALTLTDTVGNSILFKGI